MQFDASRNSPSASSQYNPQSRLHRLIAYRYTGLFCLLFALLVFLPMGLLGLSLDDYIHYQVISGTTAWPESGSWILRLFTFFDSDIARTRAMVEHIALPWWTDDSIKINFFRPFSAWTQWLDYQFWPESTAMKHLHNVLWYSALIGAVYLLTSRLQQHKAIALLATFIFAFDFAHYLNVSWIAGRNALIAVFFGALSLYFHHLWSQQSQTGQAQYRYALLAALCFLTGLLAGETAVASGAYLLSYALFIDRGSLARKIASLLPYAVIFVCWWLGYKALGFGTANTGFYLDPGKNPAEFISELLHRWPSLLFSQWSGLPMMVFLKTLTGVPALLLMCMLAFLALISWLLWPLLKISKTARFWLAGSTLAMLPSASALPHERVLLFADIGGAAVLAQLFYFWASKCTEFKASRWKSLALVLLFSMHALIHPLAYLLAGTFIAASDRNELYRISTELPVNDISTGQQMIYLNQPHTTFFSTIILARTYYNMPVANDNYILGSNNGTMEITRINDQSLRIRMSEGLIPENRGGRYALIFRALENPLKPGDTIKRGQCQYTIEALSASAGFPKQFVFSCNQSLDDKQFVWLQFKDNATVKWQPPAINKSISIEPAPLS
jgi:hypothetical protein